MTAGQLIAVVGPSGVGKDSVMQELVQARPDLTLVRRMITRAPGLGGEVYDAVTPKQFAEAAARRAFCLRWEAHGLHYGIPKAVLQRAKAGESFIANLSRSALREANTIFPSLLVLHVTASPRVLAERLAQRGRETEQEIAQRLKHSIKALPDGLHVAQLCNDGPLDETIARALSFLTPQPRANTHE